MNHCETCKYHGEQKDQRPGAPCTHNKITENWLFDEEYEIDKMIYSYSEGGIFWTGDKFGCVHHKEVIKNEQ